MNLKALLKSFNSKSKQNFLIYGLGQAFNLLSPLIVAPFVVLVCKVDGFGKVGLGFALALFLILIVDYAFDIKGTKEVSENRLQKEELEKILNRTIFTKIVLFGAALIIALGIIYFIPFFQDEKRLFLFSLSIVFAQVFSPNWFLQGIENFTFFSLVNICAKTTYVILVFSLVNSPEDYVYVNLFLGASTLFFNVFGLVLIKIKYQFKIKYPNFYEVKFILKNDFFFCISQLFLSVRQLSPLILAGFFLGYGTAGLYKVMEQIITLVRTFIQVFLKFFFPRLCYIVMEDTAEGLHFWKRYTLINAVLLSFFLALIFIFSEQVLGFFNISEKLIQPLNAVFKLSLVVSLLMSLSLPLEQLMFVFNNNKTYIRVTIIVTIVNLTLIMQLINTFQLYGIITALIISEILFIGFYYKISIYNFKSKG
jgi:O-antigen/teichoic acid export membrane protein